VTPAALLQAARQWQAEAVPAMVVAVQAARGSVPRPAGTRMLVSGSGVRGTIGGGHLELQAIAAARGLLRQGPAVTEQHIALGPTLGQCCGGALDLRYTRLADEDLARWPAAAPRFSLQLYGAGHVGRAVVRLLADIDCRVQWIDEREGEFPPDPLPPHIDRVCVEPVAAEVAQAAPGTHFLVLTHSHDLDLALTQAILARGDFAWFGLIGSATKRARFEARLRQRGVDEALLRRMVCPIGLPGITGKEPAVIALAVVAQLLQSQGAADPLAATDRDCV
jgi:xanthine dehydrogenase accessory factor